MSAPPPPLLQMPLREVVRQAYTRLREMGAPPRQSANAALQLAARVLLDRLLDRLERKIDAYLARLRSMRGRL